MAIDEKTVAGLKTSVCLAVALALGVCLVCGLGFFRSLGWALIVWVVAVIAVAALSARLDRD